MTAGATPQSRVATVRRPETGRSNGTGGSWDSAARRQLGPIDPVAFCGSNSELRGPRSGCDRVARRPRPHGLASASPRFER